MAKDSLNVSLRQIFMNEVDPRRKQELQDASILNEDHTQMANLPAYGFQKIWQKNKVYSSPYDDYGV